MEFMKFFKRQKSTNKSTNSNENNNADFSVEINGNNNVFGSSISSDTSSSRHHTTAESEQIVFSQSLNEESSLRPHSLFKEPRGWRKSLRKLKRKKKNDLASNSCDNIINRPQDEEVNISVNEVQKKSPGHVSKRWSYSPDLNEDTVPGAKDFRGCLERKLSVRVEEPATSPSSKTQSEYDDKTNEVYPLPLNTSQEHYYDSNSNFFNQEDNDLDRTIMNSSMRNNQSFDDFKTPIDSPLPHHIQKQNNVVSTSLTDLHVQPCQSQQRIYQSNPSIPQIAALKPPTQSNTTSTGDYENRKEVDPNGIQQKQYTPEEEEMPYDLDDIDDILARYPSRAATLRPATSSQEGLRSTGNLELYNDQSEYNDYSVRSNGDTNDDTSQLTTTDNITMNSEQYASPSRSQSAEVKATIYDNVDLPGNSDDNVSWGSNEFDSASEVSEEIQDDEAISSEAKDDCEEKSFVHRKQRITSKDFGKEVQKLKFWERGSSRKNKAASQPTKERQEEPSLFVDIKISSHRHPGPRLAEPPPTLEKYQKRRRNIVETIIQSESSYIDSLQRLEIDYKQTLLDQKPPILSSEVVEKIFFKIADILQCHQLFQIALAASVADWDEHECIGETFVASFSKSMVLECYSDFINNFTNAMDTVRKMCLRKPTFLTFLRVKQGESPSRLNLYGLMLKPVQRFPQFIMIVQDLLKNTPPEHPDKLPLQLALTELETLAENLNQRRADDEEKAAMNELLETSNIKLPSTTTKDGHPRRVLKKGTLQEWVYNEEGSLEKMKDVSLVLTNDMLICCGISNRRPQRTGTSTTKDTYKLRWRVALDVMTIKDNNENEQQSEAIEPMIEDYDTMKQISALVQRLNISHYVLTSTKVDVWVQDLESKIRQAEGVARQPRDAAFTVHFPEKSGDVHRMLVVQQPTQKDEWLEDIYNAQRANTLENLHGWYTADGSASENLWPSPLYLRDVLAHPNQKSLQVQCAFAFMPASHVTLLWLSCAASTVVAVVSVYYIVDEKIERVHVMQVESSVQCIEKWNPFDTGASVWLGMESGSLIEYSAEDYHKMCEVSMPTMSTVMLMKGFKNNLYVGLLDGTLAMYTRYEGEQGLEHITSITAGSGPLNCLSPADGKLWGSCGNDLVTINLENFSTESTRTLPTDDPSLVVSHVVQVGCGLWVAFCNSCNLNLFHFDSLRLLQDLNLSRNIRDYMQNLGLSKRVSEPCYVTCLWSSYFYLLVGTSNGLVLAMPLPKLPGSVPKITGPCKVSYHTLRGPVQFLCAPEMPPIKKGHKTKSVSSPPPIDDNFNVSDLPPPPPELLEEDNKKMAAEVADEDAPPKVPERSPISKKSHKRTTSDGNLAVHHEKLSPSRPMSSYIPNGRKSFSNGLAKQLEIKRKFSPPPIPPRPNDLPPLPYASSSNLLEDDKVYMNKNIEKIQSPRKQEVLAPWDENNHNSRSCPVIIACGDGYKYLARNKKFKDTSKQQDPSTSNLPSIICWKILQ